MNLPPVLRQRYFSSNGLPLAGGKIYTYQAGTSTPQSTYTDYGGGTQNTNPIILDANGEASMWLDQNLSYKFVLKDSSDVTQWTADNIIGILTNNSVTSASIQDNAVTTSKILDANITRVKLAAGAISTMVVAASKLANFTALTTEDFYPCDATAGNVTATLYAAASNAGRRLTFVKTDTSANTVIIDPNASETIDGILTRTLAKKGDFLSIICDGSNWFVTAGKTSSEIALAGGNMTTAQGTTNTKIRCFVSTPVVSFGSAITYTPSNSLGDSFTINEPGAYQITRTDFRASGSVVDFGISLNSASLTTSIVTIASTERVAYVSSGATTGLMLTCSQTLNLKVGDVIRAHEGDNVATSFANLERCLFRITKVS